MQEKSFTRLDFDEAVALARQNPEAFEQYRLDTIETVISCASKQNQRRLRCLQWRIDQVRKRAPDPADACVKIYQMMWDSVTGKYGFIDIICNGNYPHRNAEDTASRAKVLALSDARKRK
ncbi:MAG TPA: DUF3135 domain-containing protein [Gammaproteobacteria bacterium]|nr:DUF3135 domain-containing protein [Gammaproteobacteria bacterium]